jgi:hypothetical protein
MPITQEPLTAAQLRRIISYDPVNGVFVWAVNFGMRAKIGSRAGCVNKKGYRYIAILGKKYRASRIAWLYMTGAWPPSFIDHQNGNRSDDRWDNLRLATVSQNAMNQRLRRDSRTQLKGVSKNGIRWKASIQLDGKRVTIGNFSTAKDASDAYAREAAKKFGKFARVE